MSDNTDNREAPLVKIAQAIGPILGIPLALFAIVTSIVEQPLIALVVALITAIGVSVWVVKSGRMGINNSPTCLPAITGCEYAAMR